MATLVTGPVVWPWAHPAVGKVLTAAGVAGDADSGEEGFEERAEGGDGGGNYADTGLDRGPDRYV